MDLPSVTLVEQVDGNVAAHCAECGDLGGGTDREMVQRFIAGHVASHDIERARAAGTLRLVRRDGAGPDLIVR